MTVFDYFLIFISIILIFGLIFMLIKTISEHVNYKWYKKREDNISKSLLEYAITISYEDSHYKINMTGKVEGINERKHSTHKMSTIELVKVLKRLQNNSISEVLYPLFIAEYQKKMHNTIHKEMKYSFKVTP